MGFASKFNLQRAYREHVERSRRKLGHEAAMHYAVGGQFVPFGILHKEMLRFYGLEPHHSVVEIGCGAGKLAIPLSREHPGPYLGVDLVPDLVDYARAKCARPDWRFEVVSGLSVPAADESADMVCLFSVFTHMLHEQTFIYLKDIRRVLKPGGRIVFSFLEFRMLNHWTVFEGTVRDAEMANEHPLNVFLDRDAITAFAERLELRIDEFRDGIEPFVPLPHPLTLDDGSVMEGLGYLGQSVCVLSKPQAQPNAAATL
jgi:SAM-dependent methyltransferase